MSIGLRATQGGSVPMQTKCMESSLRQGARTSREYKFVPLQYRFDVLTRSIHYPVLIVPQYRSVLSLTLRIRCWTSSVHSFCALASAARPKVLFRRRDIQQFIPSHCTSVRSNQQSQLSQHARGVWRESRTSSSLSYNRSRRSPRRNAR